MKLTYLTFEHTAPESFPWILGPAEARYALERNYLFGGAAGMSICSRHHITRNTQSGIGITDYREDAAMKRQVLDDINCGRLLAIDESDGGIQRIPGTGVPGRNKERGPKSLIKR